MNLKEMKKIPTRIITSLIIVALILSSTTITAFAETQIEFSERPGYQCGFSSRTDILITFSTTHSCDLYAMVNEVGAPPVAKDKFDYVGRSGSPGPQGKPYIPANVDSSTAKMLYYYGTANEESGADVTDSPIYSVLLPAYNDTTSPVVNSCSFANLNLSAGKANLKIMFNEVMDITKAGTIKLSTGSMVAVAANDSRWSADRKILTIPVTGLKYNQTINVSLSDFQDPVPNVMTATSKQVVTPKEENKPVLIKATFKANKGKFKKGSKKTKLVTYGNKYGKLPTVTRKGYKFLGWYTKKSGGTKITKNTKMTSKKNVNIYANWKKSIKLKFKKGKITNRKTVNMRSGPGNSYNAIAVLKKNKKIKIKMAVRNGKNTWYKVTVGKKTGYIYSKYVKKS